MSVKRAATTELNHDNWDQDETEQEEQGTFKPASKDVIEKRVIRTAKRRSQVVTSEEGQKGVFSGFKGFSKSQPTSFDFLSNVTNGNKMNGSPSSKNDTTVTSSLFSSTAPTMFGTQPTPTFTPKTSFGSPTQTSLFNTTPNVQTETSVFTASKADSTVGDTAFKINPISSSTEQIKEDISNTAKVTQVTSTLFGTSSANISSKSLFSSSNNSTPFKSQPVSSSTTIQSSFGTATTVTSKTNNEKNEKNASDDKRLKYISALKVLNESVSEWIKNHVDKTPVCILTPIFKDYERHLKELQQEYHGIENDKKNEPNSENKTVKDTENEKSSNFHVLTKSPSSKTDTLSKSNPIVSGSPSQSSVGEKSTFSFGIKPSDSASITTPGNTSFSFGTNILNTNNLSTTNVSSNGSGQFSFGIGKPFSFGSSIQKPTADTTKDDQNEEADEPPKVEYIPIVEENSVYDKKCKIFVKKDGNYVDKGLGTLYIKKIEETGKHQLLVRANNSLGNVLLNMILVTSIPTQRMGKNNVMMVCIPTPESKPPPTPVLIRVKTSKEADELLVNLNKYKI